MRLLDTTYLTLCEFSGDVVEPYAILSHCWSHAPNEEATYHQVVNPNVSVSSTGWQKIERCCAIARERGFGWVWIDTVCIDKTSSAELSEAINSMFKWYEQASECYVFLDDVTTTINASGQDGQRVTGRSDHLHYNLEDCKWFTRGWTLQELLAPPSVLFYTRDNVLIGTRTSMFIRISRITGIDEAYVKKDVPIHHASVAQRLSWASRRRTTRLEDMAYSLLGIFAVNMPLLYGEGGKAFIRLQLAIIESSDDDSIFAWGVDAAKGGFTSEAVGVLATSPSDFHQSRIVSWASHGRVPRSRSLARPMQKSIEFRRTIGLSTVSTLVRFLNVTHVGGLDSMVLASRLTKHGSLFYIEIALVRNVMDGKFYRIGVSVHAVSPLVDGLSYLIPFEKPIALAPQSRPGQVIPQKYNAVTNWARKLDVQGRILFIGGVGIAFRIWLTIICSLFYEHTKVQQGHYNLGLEFVLVGLVVLMRDAGGFMFYVVLCIFVLSIGIGRAANA